MTGYEKSPDYGGRPVTWRTWLFAAVFVGGLVAIPLYLVFGPV